MKNLYKAEYTLEIGVANHEYFRGLLEDFPVTLEQFAAWVMLQAQRDRTHIPAGLFVVKGSSGTWYYYWDEYSANGTRAVDGQVMYFLTGGNMTVK
jgi:hypothetical protein